MGDVLDLDAYRASRRLAEAVAALNRELDETELPDPSHFGWKVVERDDLSRPVRWFHPRYRATMGYVPGNPEWVYVDYAHRCHAWQLTVEELALGLETGCLPEPEHTVET